MFARLSLMFSWIDFDRERLEAFIPAMTEVLNMICIKVRYK